MLSSIYSSAPVQTSTTSANLPSGIKSYAEAVSSAKVKDDSMNQTDFLTLFTTQLKNQNPLDPVKNEAFVAQLAQFSQLEATTNMSNSMNSLVQTLGNDKILSGANLIGRTISVPGGSGKLEDGQPVLAAVNLPTGADGIRFDVYDSKGAPVRSQVLGPQLSGDMTWMWDGKDETGNLMPNGNYRFQATALSQGDLNKPVVSTLNKIVSVSKDPTSEVMLLEVEDGQRIDLATVSRIGA